MDITNFVYSRRDAALQIGDYGTYRAQLSRQLASARKRLGRSTPKNVKYSQRAPITAEDIGGNPE
jgi:signal recognition particle subunit SRP68